MRGVRYDDGSATPTITKGRQKNAGPLLLLGMIGPYSISHPSALAPNTAALASSSCETSILALPL